MIKRVKAAALVLSAAMAFAAVTGCGGESPAPAPVEETVDMDDPNEGLGDLIEEEPEVEEEAVPEEEAEPEEDTEGAGENGNEYGALYFDKIDELTSEGLADQFALADIDSDGIPELIASDSEGSYDHENAFIFTIADAEVTELASVISGVDGGNLDYAEGANLIHVSGSAAGMRDQFFEIKEGKLEEVFAAEASSMDDDAQYSVNGETVKEDEYYGQINGFLETCNPMIRIAYDGLYEINYKFEDGYGYFDQGSADKYSPSDEIKKELQ